MRAFVFFTLITLLSSQLKAQHSMLEPFQVRAQKLGLVYVTDISLPGRPVRFDYQSIDSAQPRLYISHMGANSVIVFDLESRKIVGEVRGIPAPTGILNVPGLNRVYVSASAANKVYVVNSSNLKVVGTIRTRRFPDGIALDPVNDRLFVSDEVGKSVTVIGTHTDKVVANIAMDGEVGNTHYDSSSGLVYSTVQTRDELVAIDPNALRILKRYKLEGCKGPHGFYIDAKTRYAIITGEDDASYVVFDLADHKILSRGSVGRGPDVLAFDEITHRLYIASESGVVTVLKVSEGKVTKVGEAFFEDHAHTVSVDAASHLVFFPLQNLGGHPVLRIMKASD